MIQTRILRYIFALVSLLPLMATAQQAQLVVDTTKQVERIRGVQYSSREAAAAAQQAQPDPLFAGASISTDVAGMVMAVASSWGQIEAAARLNLKNRYFPIFEMGWGLSNHTDAQTDQHYKTNAPYFRIGCDYNFVKNKFSGNRIFGGVRYAFSSFKYDLNGPALTDPVWNGSLPYKFTGVNASAHWIELVGGLEARIMRFFHIGWSVRYRQRLSQKRTSLGQAWYIPGYGRNDTSGWGGTFNLIFDIN